VIKETDRGGVREEKGRGAKQEEGEHESKRGREGGRGGGNGGNLWSSAAPSKSLRVLKLVVRGGSELDARI